MPIPLIAAAAAGAGLSLLGGLAGNAAIEKSATENWNATLMGLDQKRGVDYTNLLYKGEEVNQRIGLELTNLNYEARKARASTVATTTDRNIYGATAAKLQGQVDMEAAMMTDNIIQSGEAAMTDVQMGLSNAMYDFNAGVQQASIQRANTLSQQKGAFELLTGAATTGIMFASGAAALNGGGAAAAAGAA